MDCRSARKNLSRYVDRELPDDLQRAFEDHLAACPVCRREAVELRSLLEIFVEPAAVPAPARLYGLIRDRLPDAEPVRRFPWWRPVLVPALAAAAFILTALASANLIPRIFVPPADRRLQVTSATLDLSVFHDAPGSTLAGAYDKVTGE